MADGVLALQAKPLTHILPVDPTRFLAIVGSRHGNQVSMKQASVRNFRDWEALITPHSGIPAVALGYPQHHWQPAAILVESDGTL